MFRQQRKWNDMEQFKFDTQGYPGDKLVIFDLDGTLLKGQSQQLLLSYLREQGVITFLPFLRIFTWFLCRRAGLVSDPKSVMEYAFRFLSGWETERFEQLIGRFFKENLKPALHPVSCELLKLHQDRGAQIVLVSNAIEPIVRTVARHFGIRHCIATRLEEKGGAYTGRIAGSPVHGRAKAALIRDFITRHGLTLEGSVAYCDQISDLPVLEMVARSVAVNPDRRLARIARARRWQVVCPCADKG